MKTFSSRGRLTLALALCLFPLFGSMPAFSQTALAFVSPLFTDNMVLQRDMLDRVWGWTTPGAAVTVSFDGRTAHAVAAADGSWNTLIGPFKAGGPYTLTVSGPQTASFANVLVGDVWLCSGQSNMEFGIENGNNAAQEIANANYSNIRLFTVAKVASAQPQALTTGQWQAVTPATIQSQGTWNGFSAVGYFFARDLQSAVHVPIGLIQSSWGGTLAEAWTSGPALTKALPAFEDAVDALDTSNAALPIDKRAADWYAKNDAGTAGNWQDPSVDVSAWNSIPVPGYYQQAGIPELAGINAILWYRTTFDLPAGDVGKDGVLHIQVDDNDTTWINGVQVGATVGVFVNRAYSVPAADLKPTGNVLVVRDLDTGGVGGIIGDGSALKLSFDGGTDIALAGSWKYRIGANVAQLPTYPDNANNNPGYPTELFNAMINPIDQFGIKGVIWYQGEANSVNPQQYRTILPTMIEDWRTRWNEGNFPFLIVQLAGWQPGGPSWPEVRQAQWLTAVNVPNAGIVTAIDIGDENSVHPKNKQEVGRRLAQLAEAKVYGLKAPYSGPVFKSASLAGSTIRVRFDQTAGGLVAQGGTPLQGFEISGIDGKFFPADAVIQGNAVVLSSPQVPSPSEAQYDWSSYPSGNLYNAAGLPAFPFKTDER